MKQSTSLSPRNLGLALLALILVAGLGVLYAKTETIDLRGPNEIASLLRELKEFDGLWDVDVVRLNPAALPAWLPPDVQGHQTQDRHRNQAGVGALLPRPTLLC